MSSESETGRIRKSSGPKAREKRIASTKHAVRSGPKLQIRQLVRFRLDDEEYGIDVHLVDEIRRAGGIVTTRIESARICGTITVADRTVDVVDVRSSLGYPTRPADSRTRIILVRHNDRVRGMLVDTVSEVIRITGKPERAEASVESRVDPELIRETLWVDEQSIAVLDWLRILDL